MVASRKVSKQPKVKPFFIGIAGGTGSGKTTVLKNLISQLGPDQVVCLSHDDYYLKQDHLTMAEREKVNYDHPSAIETKLLVKHLEQLKAGKTIKRPVYDFALCTRTSETVLTQPKPVVIVEGILTFQYEPLREFFDLKIFVDTDADIRLGRKIIRDIQERGRTLEKSLNQYLTATRPMHQQFVEPTKYYADIIIPEGGDNSVAIDVVAAKILSITQGN